jgi:hypothetical protein
VVSQSLATKRFDKTHLLNEHIKQMHQQTTAELMEEKAVVLKRMNIGKKMYA